MQYHGVCIRALPVSLKEPRGCSDLGVQLQLVRCDGVCIDSKGDNYQSDAVPTPLTSCNCTAMMGLASVCKGVHRHPVQSHPGVESVTMILPPAPCWLVLPGSEDIHFALCR